MSAGAQTTMAAWRDARPVVALMGEYSAGKSTLLNALLGKEILPTRATATAMPPVWITQGPNLTVQGLRADGRLVFLDPADLSHGAAAGFVALRVSDPAPFLTEGDILDTPGTSDVRMDAAVIPMIAGFCDLVVWCSPATQLWRQSEKAMWTSLPERLRETSLLAVTRIDTVRKARDKEKVLTRATREAIGLFDGVFPIAGKAAVEAAGKRHAKSETARGWTHSGAEALWNAMVIRLRAVDRRPSLKTQPSSNEDDKPVSSHDAMSLTEVSLAPLLEEMSQLRDASEIAVPRTAVEQLKNKFLRKMQMSAERRNIVEIILGDLGSVDPLSERTLRQILGELTDFSEGVWCDFGTDNQYADAPEAGATNT